jgi:hypothetical protein
MVEWLRARPGLVVGDFGCGEALLAGTLPNKVYSFDHVAINDQVLACDMAHTGLQDSILDVAIFSLSLMGTNLDGYLREAHRLLRLDGRLKVAEAMGHWQGEKREHLIQMLSTCGFAIIGSVVERGSFIYVDTVRL